MGSDEFIEFLFLVEYVVVELVKFFDICGLVLIKYLKIMLLGLVEKDFEGIDVVVEFVGEWVDEVIEVYCFIVLCMVLGFLLFLVLFVEDFFGFLFEFE